MQQNGENFTAQDSTYPENGGDEAPVNENHNGVGPASVVFRDGIGIQQTSNGDYEDDGDIGDDENEEVRFNITIRLILLPELHINTYLFYRLYQYLMINIVPGYTLIEEKEILRQFI